MTYDREDERHPRNLLAWEEFKRHHQLRKPEKRAIESLAWAMEWFGSLCTTRYCRRSTVLGLVALGIAESVGQVAVCDDDTTTKQPERYREGFRLTEFGKQVHAIIVEDYARKAAVRQELSGSAGGGMTWTRVGCSLLKKKEDRHAK